jgi:hypothetical protein
VTPAGRAVTTVVAVLLALAVVGKDMGLIHAEVGTEYLRREAIIREPTERPAPDTIPREHLR